MTASHSTLNIQHLTFQPMRSPSRFLSRISIRLALFNLLVVFLPVAGMLFLGSYEQRLEQAQIDSMQRQARLVVSMMHSGATAPAALRNVRFGDERIRVVDPSGHVIADTGPLQAEEEGGTGPQSNWLYRAGKAVLKKPLQWLRPIRRPLAASDAYERSAILRGQEVQAAFVGQTGVEKRVSSAPPGRWRRCASSTPPAVPAAASNRSAPAPGAVHNCRERASRQRGERRLAG